MALWQNTFFIVPKTGNYTLFEGIKLNSFMDEGFFDDELLWENIDFDITNFEILDRVLRKGKSWSDNILLFGKEDDSCFEILVLDKQIKSFSVRLNFTSNYKEMLEGLIDFCIRYGLMIVDENLNVFEPEFSTINNSIRSSKVFKKYHSFVDKQDNESKS